MPAGLKQKPLKMPKWARAHKEAQGMVKDRYNGYQAAHNFIIQSAQVAHKDLWKAYEKEVDEIYETLSSRAQEVGEDEQLAGDDEQPTGSGEGQE